MGSGPAHKTYVVPGSALAKAEEDLTNPDLTQNGGGLTAGPITAQPNDVIEYRLTYTNGGRGAASQVMVTDVVPVDHSAYVTGSCTGGDTCTYESTAHKLTWNLGTVQPGGTVTLTFKTLLGNDFPAGVVTQVSNFGVVSTFEEGTKDSNTVVTNIQVPVQQVLEAATPALPKAGHAAPSAAPRWMGMALLALLGLVALGALGRLGEHGHQLETAEEE